MHTSWPGAFDGVKTTARLRYGHSTQKPCSFAFCSTQNLSAIAVIKGEVNFHVAEFRINVLLRLFCRCGNDERTLWLGAFEISF